MQVSLSENFAHFKPENKNIMKNSPNHALSQGGLLTKWPILNNKAFLGNEK